jgi:EAL domain-containing protein (putative c-di-GMP-specific phosphodiesterase class I)
LVLFSQAIVPLRGGQPREELLVRMVGRDGEIVSPATFIPTAEQFGLAYGIDRWVLERAIELALRGRAVELNISGATVGEDRIVARLTEAVDAGVDPSLLTFEITETAAFRNLDAACRFAHAITSLGAGSR